MISSKRRNGWIYRYMTKDLRGKNERFGNESTRHIFLILEA